MIIEVLPSRNFEDFWFYIIFTNTQPHHSLGHTKHGSLFGNIAFCCYHRIVYDLLF